MKHESMAWRIESAGAGTDVLSPPARMLARGCLAVYPTETFYALGCVPFFPDAVEKIFVLKGRDFLKPLPLIASDMGAVRRASSGWSGIAESLARAFWPGPLTLVLPAARSLPPVLHAGTGTVAVRISSHPIARLLAEAAGGLLVATSANKSGEPPPSSPRAISREIFDGIDGFVDAGDLPGGFPSSIVDVTVHPPRLLRTGAVGREVILGVIEAEKPFA